MAFSADHSVQSRVLLNTPDSFLLTVHSMFLNNPNKIYFYKKKLDSIRHYIEKYREHRKSIDISIYLKYVLFFN